MTFNLIGSIFLGLYIIGNVRLKKIEKFITSIPNTVIKKFMGTLVRKITEKMINKSPSVQINLKKFFDIVSEKKGKVNLYPNGDKEVVKFMVPYFIFVFLVASALWIAIFPFVVILFLVIKPLFYIQEKLGIKSFLGLVGILFLIAGFILQIL